MGLWAMEEIKQSYYSIIPGYVRYDKNLKAAEKLFYSEVTALTNKCGYCFATNKYFEDLYSVSTSTISRWISTLVKAGYIKVQLIRNDKKQIEERRIFINDDTYSHFCVYPYTQNYKYPISKNAIDNNINKNMIDDLFILILNNSPGIPEKFCDILEKLGLLYNTNSFDIIKGENQDLIKNIVYTLYLIYNSNFDFLLTEFSRESLINLYRICIEKKPTDNIHTFIQYYKRALINKYTNNST